MENLRLDDFTKYKFLSGIKYSPNGENACFVLHEMDVEDNRYLSNLYLYRVKENKYIRLTAFNQETGFIWLDDETILFPGMRNPKDKEKADSGEELTIFYTININGGEAVEAFKITKKVSAIKKIDQNTYVLTGIYNADKVDLNTLTPDEKSKELKRRKEEKDYEVLDEIPFWSNGGGFTNKNRNRLYIYHVNTDTLEAVTGEYTDVEVFNLNKDNTKVVFTGLTYKNKMELKNTIYIYDLSSKTVESLTPDEKFSYSFVDFYGEDKIICTGSSLEPYGIFQNDKFYVIDLKTKERKCLTPDFDCSVTNSVNSDCRYGTSQSIKVDGDHIYFVTTEWEYSYLNRTSLDGKIERLSKSNGSVDGFDVNNGKVLFIGLRGLRLQELYILDNSEENQITFFNQWVQKTKKLSIPQKLTVETAPGVKIDGWVMKPVDFDESKKYPAILNIHGGPKTVYGDVFVHEMQYWANSGYFVFFCNPRGGDGRGNEFADIRGRYGTIDYDDLMVFTDTVLENNPNIDRERVGVTGGSYGGFMTNWIVGHTHRFKAAATQRSIANWISKFNTTDIGYYFTEDQLAATPWGDVDKLWEQSPLKYADRVKTPTLILHSEEDYRCWLVEGIQFFTALKYHGVESRLVMFRGENHELSRSGKPKHRVRRLTEITNWFDGHLK